MRNVNARKYLNTALLSIKSLMYLAICFIFVNLLAQEHPQLLRLSRTSVVVISAFFILEYLTVSIFGGFDIGKKQVRDITNSLLLVVFVTDILSYMVLIVMNTNQFTDNRIVFSGVAYLFVSMLLQILMVIAAVLATNKFYYNINKGRKCCVFLGEGATLEKLQPSIRIKGLDAAFVIDTLTEAALSDESMHAIEQTDVVICYNVAFSLRREIVEYAYKLNRSIYFNPEISDIVEITAEHQMFSDVLMLAAHRVEMPLEQRFVKRLIDIVGSVLLLVVSSPIFLICAIMIKCDDHGRVFFKQKRATIHGKQFWIYKFRTMKPSEKTLPAEKGDDRITKAGSIIRSTRMDELPQLLNVLKGDMSLVGPRPEQVQYIHGFDQNYEDYEYRLRAKAGLTGYAQIEGKYNTSNKDKLMLDLMYIQNYSIWLDIKLIFKTILVFFKKESTEGF